MKTLTNNYRILSIVLTLLFVAETAISQSNLAGRILDESSNEGIEYATVSVFSAADSSLIEGTISLSDGRFEMTDLATTDIFCTAQFLGYVTFESEVMNCTDGCDLGDIVLSLNRNTLDEVVVTGKEITAVYQLDKQVFDASQFQNAQGGTASDVLKNLPSLSINSFGDISVRGATGFLVMVNGKPIQGSPMAFLQQLPANAVEDIEIVTAPSAKYDPDGNAGIINIKTRQAISDGTYLVANVLLGLPSVEPYENRNPTPRYGADVTYNRKVGKWNFSGGLDYRRYDISGRREGYVNTYLGDVLTEFPSDGERSFDEVNYSARTSLTYSPSAASTWAAGVYLGKRNKERTADILYNGQQRTRIASNDFLGTEAYFDRFQQNGSVFTGGEQLNSLTYFNENLRIRRSDFFIGSLDYNYRFSNKASLKLSTLYERTILGGPTDNANLDFPNTNEILQLQFNDNVNPLDGFRFQGDYTQKLGFATLDLGYQYRFLQHPGEFEYFDRDLENQVWVPNPLFTNSINLTRSIHSVYSQVSGSREQWEYVVGLRAEYFDRRVEIARPEATYDLKRFNLFPSLNLGYNLGSGLSFKTGYSRRIERTTTFKMTPFPEREHSETLEQGDAELLPEYINLVELGVVKKWGDHSVFATGFLRNVENAINRVNTVFNDTILNRIYTNVGTANAIGLELGGTAYPAKNWRIYAGGNIYNYRINGDLFMESINTSNVVYSINANTNYNFGKGLTVQLGFNYLSERITAQGRDSEFYNPSMTIRKTFIDDKLGISLQWLNIDMGLWNANEQRITTVRDNFYTTTNYVYEVDILQLTVSYQLNKRKNTGQMPESEFGKKEF